MELRQDLDNGKAMFTAVSQFLVTHPVLSFGVREVAYSRLQNTELLPTEEESESLSAGLHACSSTYVIRSSVDPLAESPGDNKMGKAVLLLLVVVVVVLLF